MIFSKMCRVENLTDYSITQLAVLELACSHLAGKSTIDYSSQLLLPRPNISRSVQKLGEAGLIISTRDPHDARRVQIVATREGHAAISSIQEAVAQ